MGGEYPISTQKGHSRALERYPQNASSIIVNHLEPADERRLPRQYSRFPKFGHLCGGVVPDRLNAGQIDPHQVDNIPVLR